MLWGCTGAPSTQSFFQVFPKPRIPHEIPGFSCPLFFWDPFFLPQPLASPAPSLSATQSPAGHLLPAQGFRCLGDARLPRAPLSPSVIGVSLLPPRPAYAGLWVKFPCSPSYLMPALVPAQVALSCGVLQPCLRVPGSVWVLLPRLSWSFSAFLPIPTPPFFFWQLPFLFPSQPLTFFPTPPPPAAPDSSCLCTFIWQN